MMSSGGWQCERFEFRRAALEQPAELSGLSAVQAKAIADETLALRYPNELAGINDARQAMEAVSTAFHTVRKAVEHELKTTSGTVQGATARKFGAVDLRNAQNPLANGGAWRGVRLFTLRGAGLVLPGPYDRIR
jgi:hypothetical protein